MQDCVSPLAAAAGKGVVDLVRFLVKECGALVDLETNPPVSCRAPVDALLCCIVCAICG
jgi:hypothetical protein